MEDILYFSILLVNLDVYVSEAGRAERENRARCGKARVERAERVARGQGTSEASRGHSRRLCTVRLASPAPQNPAALRSHALPCPHVRGPPADGLEVAAFLVSASRPRLYGVWRPSPSRERLSNRTRASCVPALSTFAKNAFFDRQLAARRWPEREGALGVAGLSARRSGGDMGPWMHR